MFVRVFAPEAMKMANNIQTCGTKHPSCCVVQRQPAHGEQVNGYGTVHCVSVIQLLKSGWAFSGLSSASGRSQKETAVQHGTVTPFPSGPSAVCALCVSTDFTT